MGLPPIPEAGLSMVLSSWTGRGSVLNAIAATADERDDRNWSPSKVRQRAHRILLSRIEPLLLRMPKRVGQWVDLLPASRRHYRTISDVPFSGVSWGATRVRFGWPPAAFVGRQSERSADMLSVTSLKWMLEKLALVWADSLAAFPESGEQSVAQVDSALALLEIDPVMSAAAFSPLRSDLSALRREGAPWGAVAAAIHELQEAEKSLDHLVWQLLLPDDDIRWRLFHLGVLGCVLIAIRSAGCHIISQRPIDARSTGPNYFIETLGGERFELWFEASGVWAQHGISAPYIEATSAMTSARRALGADLLLINPGNRALVVECKYSSEQEFIARNGYYQAMTYAAEVRSRLSPEVTSVAVGPEGVVPAASFTETIVGRIGVIPPSALADVVRQVLG